MLERGLILHLGTFKIALLFQQNVQWKRLQISKRNLIIFMHLEPYCDNIYLCTELLNYWVTEVLSYWVTELLSYWVTELLSYRVTELQSYRVTELLSTCDAKGKVMDFLVLF